MVMFWLSNNSKYYGFSSPFSFSLKSHAEHCLSDHFTSKVLKQKLSLDLSDAWAAVLSVISLPVGGRWWTSHQDLRTSFQILSELLLCMFEPVPELLCSTEPGDSQHSQLWYTAHIDRVSEQPCGSLRISSHYPQSKFLLRFFLLKKHIIGLQISLQKLPLL